MKKTMTILAIAGLVLALAPVAQAVPIVAPTDGYTGPYRLAFQTNGSTLATLADMAAYNTFVTTEAGLITELAALSTTWTAIGSTTIVDAKDNILTNVSGDISAVPIYTTTGLKIADNTADLWTGSIDNPIFFGDGTTTVPNTFGERAFTGTATDGTAYTSGDGRPLSSGPGQNIRMVGGGAIDSAWISQASFSDADSRGLKMLAISGVIPEPATMSLLAIGGIALLRRKRRA